MHYNFIACDKSLHNADASGEILSLCDSYHCDNREFFFDRSTKIFESILGLYRKGELHLTEGVCPLDFLGELKYWGLSALHLGKFDELIYLHKS